jgi:hypothetical protein
MKHIYLLALAALTTTNTLAQDRGTAFVTGTVEFDNKFPHFVNRHKNNAGQVQPQRLVGRTYASHDGNAFVTKDSSTYVFGNMRGGVPDVDNPMDDESILFDESITYSNENGTGFQPIQRRKQTYNSSDKVHILTYGSWRGASSVWFDSLRYVYRYENDKMVESGLEIPFNGNGWVTHVTSLMVYNGNKVVEMNATNYKMKFEYDASENLVLFTDAQWDAAASAWVNKERSTYTYAGTEMVSHNKEVWDAQTGQWKFERRKEYAYNGNHVTSIVEYYYAQSSWQRDTKHLYSYNNNNDKDVETIQTWNPATNTFVNSKQVVYKYNNYFMPTAITDYTWDKGMAGWTHIMGDKEYTYYYEAVFPSSVAKTDIEPNTLSIYPVPAAANVNIDVNFEQVQQSNISLHDMRGAIVRQWSEPATNTLHKQLDVNDIPAGNYYVTVSTAKERLTGKLVVAR